jgi:hypothetical protein
MIMSSKVNYPKKEKKGGRRSTGGGGKRDTTWKRTTKSLRKLRELCI